MKICITKLLFTVGESKIVAELQILWVLIMTPFYALLIIISWEAIKKFEKIFLNGKERSLFLWMSRVLVFLLKVYSLNKNK